MKKLFYLMRHGQTYANAKLAVEPEREFLLTDVGIQQAQAAGAYLKTIDSIIITPQRCNERRIRLNTP